MTFFLQKMIATKTMYKTYNGELLAIVEVFKMWRYYLKGSQYEVFVLIDHNNLCQFINMKSLSSRQVRWAQKLSHYHFWIDYCQSKASRAADALSWYPQQSPKKEKTFQAENVKIFHYLQLSLAKVSELLTSHLSLFHQISYVE